MVARAVVDDMLLPQAELARLARVLARFLAGRQPSAASTRGAGQRAGQGLDFLDYTEYQRGDDFRRIDWRASARCRQTVVRRYCGDVSSDWYLCLDASASMGFAGADKWLRARQLAAAFAYVLLHLGHRVALLMFSSTVDAMCPLGRGHVQYSRILTLLDKSEARAAGGHSDIGSCNRLLGRRAPVLVISDFLAEDAMLPALGSILAQQRELHLLQVASCHDLDLPDSDNLLLRDVETGRSVACADSAAARLGAEQRFTDLQRQLFDWSDRYRVPCTAWADDEAWRDVLLRHFMRS